MTDPSTLRCDTTALLAELRATLGGRHTDPDRLLAVLRFDGEELQVPSRLYFSHIALWFCVARGQRLRTTLALCLGTRHWDGHVREACLRRLLKRRERCAIPFVVALLGEYVIEIVEFIAQAFDDLDADALGRFARENPAFMATTRRRATSYWNEYHRQRFPDRRDYPALAMLEAIDRLVAGGAR